MDRNPATGEPIAINASKKVAFRATKELKMAVLTSRLREVRPYGIFVVSRLRLAQTFAQQL
jgi:hypothetical protein